MISEVVRYGKIPLSNPELCAEVKAIVTKMVEEANITIDVKLKNLSSWKMLQENGLKKRVNLNIEHIINYSVDFSEDILNDTLKINFNGGHLAGSTESLASKGIIKIIDREMLQTGCIEYKIQDFMNGKPFTKTEFPVHWDYKKLVQSCWEIYESPLSIEKLAKDGKFSREGLLDGCKMQVVLKKGEKTNNIITAYPIIEG